MIVILDTNIWISDLALLSSVGSAVRHYLRLQNARLGLPEVIKLETEVGLRKALGDHIEKIQSSHRQLLTLFGRLKGVVLPSAEEVEGLIADIFSKLGVEIEEIPFTLESAKASLERTIKKLPPSDKNEQFKDGVLWADCLTLLKKEAVFLVTSDKAFYKGRDLTRGLALELKKEIADLPNELKIFPSLTDLLSQIKTSMPFTEDVFVNTFTDNHGEKIGKLAANHSFAVEVYSAHLN
jgi:hypothetical protein